MKCMKTKGFDVKTLQKPLKTQAFGLESEPFPLGKSARFASCERRFRPPGRALKFFIIILMKDFIKVFI